MTLEEYPGPPVTTDVGLGEVPRTMSSTPFASVALEENPGPPVLCGRLLRRLLRALVLPCMMKLHDCE